MKKCKKTFFNGTHFFIKDPWGDLSNWDMYITLLLFDFFICKFNIFINGKAKWNLFPSSVVIVNPLFISLQFLI